MRIAAVLLGALGVAVAAYGGWLLLQEDLSDLVDTAVWLAGGVVLHDFVLVPADPAPRARPRPAAAGEPRAPRWRAGWSCSAR